MLTVFARLLSLSLSLSLSLVSLTGFLLLSFQVVDVDISARVFAYVCVCVSTLCVTCTIGFVAMSPQNTVSLIWVTILRCYFGSVQVYNIVFIHQRH